MTPLLALLLLQSSDINKDVVFAKFETTEVKMDIYFPEKERKALPCVVVIHGGAWMSGRKEDMAEMCELIARRGMVAATIDYRLAPKYKWPAQLDDSQAAVRYLRNHARELGIDKNRIGAAGASAGAHLALLLGFRDTRDQNTTLFSTESSKVKVVFDLFGPSDFSRDFPATLDPVYFALTGKKRADASDVIKEASPATYINSDCAPVFILHGKADALVPIAQSERLEALLKEAKVEVKSNFVEGMNHGVDKNTPGVTEGVMQGIEFLEKHLAK